MNKKIEEYRDTKKHIINVLNNIYNNVTFFNIKDVLTILKDNFDIIKMNEHRILIKYNEQVFSLHYNINNKIICKEVKKINRYIYNNKLWVKGLEINFI